MSTPTPPSPALTTEGETLASAPERLRYLQREPPGLGVAPEIAPGVRWIRMPLPMDLDHINLWLIERGDGWVLVDTGFASDVCREAWEALERTVLAEHPLRLILVTHAHPDHAGLAAWLQSRHPVPVWMSVATREHMRFFFEPMELPALERGMQFFAAHGAANLEELRSIIAGGRYRQLVDGVPRIEHTPGDTERFVWGGTRWDVLECAGHIEGHLCLHDAVHGVLVSGDQVLPTISPNVSLTPRSIDTDPLGSYLASLRRLMSLPAETLVLPSHGRPFRGLHARAADLIAHHEQHMATLVDACQEPRSAEDLLPLLFRRTLRGLQRFLALGEAIAHLEHLARRGRLERRADAGGHVRFVACT
jgi:glyoxylase-like metal-dependent hydrolase (beta-lactamase superfamily II)